jgi:L-alanine-DL-glutamate epimerase-like enolase superfamily enzyme
MAVADVAAEAAVERLAVSAFTVPTDVPETDGTAEWDSTTLVLVEAYAHASVGLGYTYGDIATAALIDSSLSALVEGHDALAVAPAHDAMVRRCRNLGRPGIGSMAIAAVDVALWDLKARLLGLPLATLLDVTRPGVPVYASGGFTSYSLERLQQQLGRWAAEGFRQVKMKVGREPERDLERVRAAREEIGAGVELFVDANGALSRKQALWFAQAFAEYDVRWFEEPVSSDDVEGLRIMRERAPAGMDVVAGEYGYTLPYFERMLAAGAVDCLQADATRCEGYTGFLRAAALCDAHALELSAHTAPSLHVHVCMAAPRLRNLEWFHDHVRIERLLFDGMAEPRHGVLRPDVSRPGNGLELKGADAERFRVYGGSG